MLIAHIKLFPVINKIKDMCSVASFVYHEEVKFFLFMVEYNEVWKFIDV